MTAAFPVQVVLVRRTKGPLDALGNDTYIDSASAPVNAVWAPGGSTEQIQGRDTLTITGTLYVAAGTNLSHLDAVLVNGQRFEVDGDPIDWRSPLTGWAPGIEVRVRRAAG